MKKYRTPLFHDYNKRFWLDISVITFVAVFFCYKLLINPGLPLGGDALTWIHFQKFDALHSWWFQVWEGVTFPTEGPHYISLLDNFIILLFFLFNGNIIVIKILIFATYLMTGVTMYFLVLHYYKSHNASIVSSLMYMMNRAIIDQFIIGHYAIAFGYSFFPLLFIAWKRAYKTGKLSDIILLAMSLALFVSTSHLNFTYMALITFTLSA